MNEQIITVRNISKKYNIAHQRGGYIALRDVITNFFKNPFRYAKDKAREIAGIKAKEEFWALDGVNFSIKKGEAVGIIGKNGAGKSTLLKILSQITPPTTGEIEIRGRVGSLLEVGTGFHPELTGRENILLNGAILGMSKKEIIKKFDQIVEFSGVEKFLDTPVKHYSSGMYVRLAFSVAAHMEPDILVIDEVLAVGDAEFQKKCLGKMKDITSRDGRTILFVSHNMNAVEQLCDRCIILEKGKVKKVSSDVKETINEYIYGTKESETGKIAEWKNSGEEFENKFFKPLNFYLSDQRDNRVNTVSNRNDELWLNVAAKIEEVDSSLTIGYAVYDNDNRVVYWSFNTDEEERLWSKFSEGVWKLKTKFPTNILNNTTFRVELLAALHNKVWILKPETAVPNLFIELNGQFSNSPNWSAKRPGVIAPVINWESQKVN